MLFRSQIAEKLQIPQVTQCFLHSEKAIDPLYESKSDFEILKLLAAGMGYPDLIDLTEDEYMSQVVDTPALGALGITYDAIKENEDMYWYAEKPSESVRSVVW